MKIGICCGVENLEKAESFGFDYIEVGVGSVANLSGEEFEMLRKKLLDAPIGIEAANVMLPGPFHVTGEEADHEEIRRCLEKAFHRLGKIGCGTVVFGNGGARRIPEGFSRDKAWEQLRDLSSMIASIAEKNRIVIALEPLNTKKCNVINSVAEAGRLVEEVAHPSFRLLADYYHIGMENEGLEGVRRYGKYLRHVHIAHPTIRTVPAEGDGGAYESLFGVLREVGYDLRVSIEASAGDFDREMRQASRYLKSMI